MTGFRWRLTAGVVVAVLGLFGNSVASAAPRAGADKVCLEAYMQTGGWQGEQCAPAGEAATAGEAGQGIQLEALSLSVGGSSFCAAGYVQDAGWQKWACADAGQHLTVGTKGKRLEAVTYSVQTGVLCGNSFVPDAGWNPNWYCAANGDNNAIGTTGQNKRMEAVSLLVCRTAENC